MTSSGTSSSLAAAAAAVFPFRRAGAASFVSSAAVCNCRSSSSRRAILASWDWNSARRALYNFKKLASNSVFSFSHTPSKLCTVWWYASAAFCKAWHSRRLASRCDTKDSCNAARSAWTSCRACQHRCADDEDCWYIKVPFQGVNVIPLRESRMAIWRFLSLSLSSFHVQWDSTFSGGDVHTWTTPCRSSSIVLQSCSHDFKSLRQSFPFQQDSLLSLSLSLLLFGKIIQTVKSRFSGVAWEIVKNPFTSWLESLFRLTSIVVVPNVTEAIEAIVRWLLLSLTKTM